eukprot:TRINITY_DN6351_c0_g1_i1.p1 TRINITY_DN6351_c0_g1~~TRINITY_DN6351_c0_g1_i1.p1  ORF type:complete len:775 (+),score=204.70 TRINITY_DN6351_c0_g1_i1:87-2411(+)
MVRTTTVSDRLGLGDNRDRATPSLVNFAFGQKISKICCGAQHSAAIAEDGKQVFSWGRIHEAQPDGILNPITTLGGRSFTQLSCGRSHVAVIAVNADDQAQREELLAWGYGISAIKRFKVFAENDTRRVAAMESGGNICAILTDGGSVCCLDVIEDRAEEAAGNQAVVATDAATENDTNVPTDTPKEGSKVLASEPLWLDNVPKSTRITCSSTHIVCVGENGTVYAAPTASPIKYSVLQSPTIVLNNSLDGEKIEQIACGDNYYVALTSAGVVYSWGDNSEGNLGHGNESSQKTPKAIETLKGVIIKKIACSKKYALALEDNLSTLLLKLMLGTSVTAAEEEEVRNHLKGLSNEQFSALVEKYCRNALLDRHRTVRKTLFFTTSSEHPRVELSKSVLDFRLGNESAPCSSILVDSFLITNEGNEDIKFTIKEVPRSTVYLLDFGHKTGSIPKKLSFGVPVQLTIIYPVLVNILIEIEINGKYKRYLRVKVQGKSFLTENWKLDTGQLLKGEQIGSGAAGPVFRGLYRGRTVAIKELIHYRHAPYDTNLLNKFQKEVSFLCSLHHKNIVEFIGACTDPGEQLIVTSLAERGSLYTVLRNEEYTMPLELVIKIAMDVAEGMLYLHRHRVIHRDLKSPNILIAEDWTAMLSDFGESRVLDSKMTQGIGTPQWSSPEQLQNSELAVQYSEKSDVYSFGVVLWELIMREQPYSEFRSSIQLVNEIVGGLRPVIPDNCHETLADIMTNCWSTDPQQRRTFEEIFNILAETEMQSCYISIR